MYTGCENYWTCNNSLPQSQFGTSIPNHQHIRGMQSYPCSLTHQYLPNEVRTAQPNSVPDSCVPLQKGVMRNIPNCNPHQPGSYAGPTAGPVNNHKSQTSSIRVRDFSELNNQYKNNNNNYNNNCNSWLVGGSDQSQQNMNWHYLHNPTINRLNQMSDGQMQSNRNNYAGFNYPYQNYGSAISHSNYHTSNGQQYSQYSARSYQQNPPYLRQLYLQRSEKSSWDFSTAAQRMNSSRVVAQGAVEQRRQDSRRHPDYVAKATTNDCSTFGMSESDRANLTSQAQVVRADLVQKVKEITPSVNTSNKLIAEISYQSSNNEVYKFNIRVPGTPEKNTNRDASAEAKSSDLSSISLNLESKALKGDGVSNDREEFDSGERGEGSLGVSQSDSKKPDCVRNEENESPVKKKIADRDVDNIDESIDEKIHVSLNENADENIYESVDSVLSEISEDNPDSLSTALYASQQLDDYILDETEDSDDENQHRTEISKNEINRDKLRLLIEFVKEEKEDPVEVITIEDEDPPPGKKPPKKSRKLSKTSIVRNKNADREMISMVCRAPKSSSVKESPMEEKNSGCSKNKNFVEIVTKDKPAKESNVAVEEGEGGSPKESTSACWCKDVAQGERSMINTMRAFRKRSGYFCASCSFTSPMEKIWINVVTSEVQCLNCFLKMILKSGKSHEGSSEKSRCEGQSQAKEANRQEDAKEPDENREKDVAGDKSNEKRGCEKYRKKTDEEEDSRKRRHSAEEVVPRKKHVMMDDVRQKKRDKRVSRSRSSESSSSRESTGSVDRIKKHDSTERQKSHKHDSKRRGHDPRKEDAEVNENKTPEQPKDPPEDPNQSEKADSRPEKMRRKRTQKTEEMIDPSYVPPWHVLAESQARTES